MLRDFAKINTFLTVVREKSFSRASKKLGISQPAVTQQIKLIEIYMKTPIVDRKKNGIGLTHEGKELYKIAQKLERFINNTEIELLQAIQKNQTFVIGTSPSIGKYILPNFLGEIKDTIDNEINVVMDDSLEILQLLDERKINLALVGKLNNNSNIVFREWIDDELVLCSNEKLPKFLNKDQLFDYQWIIRNEDSPVHKIAVEKFTSSLIDYTKLDTLSAINSTTAIKRTLLKTKNSQKPIIALISKHAIVDEVENGELFTSRIKGIKLKRKLYMAYPKEEKKDAFVNKAVHFIMTKSKNIK